MSCGFSCTDTECTPAKDVLKSNPIYIPENQIYIKKAKYIFKKNASLIVPLSVKKITQDSLYWDPQHFDGRGVGVFTT